VKEGALNPPFGEKKSLLKLNEPWQSKSNGTYKEQTAGTPLTTMAIILLTLRRL
jgi:hypothetical protein